MGTLGGRIDQELCNLSAIEKYSKLHAQRFIALGSSSLMFLIKEGEKAEINVGYRCDRSKSGMFCFGKSKTTTKGFKWNLDK